MKFKVCHYKINQQVLINLKKLSTIEQTKIMINDQRKIIHKDTHCQHLGRLYTVYDIIADLTKVSKSYYILQWRMTMNYIRIYIFLKYQFIMI